MADLRQATAPFAGVVAGQRVLVRAGDLYAADDPAVQAFPGKFREPVVRVTRPAPAHRQIAKKPRTPRRPARKPASKKG